MQFFFIAGTKQLLRKLRGNKTKSKRSGIKIKFVSQS